MTAGTVHPPVTAAPADLSAAADLIRDVAGPRYRVERVLETSAVWTTYRGYDQRLRRPVVLRLAVQQSGDSSALHERVNRALATAKLTVHRLPEVYDAVIVGDPLMTAPSPATALIVSSYATGTRLTEAAAALPAEQAKQVFDELEEAIAQLHEQGQTLGALRPGDVILTGDGVAITKLPIGTLAEHGRTSLRAVCAVLARDTSSAGRVLAAWITSRLTLSR